MGSWLRVQTGAVLTLDEGAKSRICGFPGVSRLFLLCGVFFFTVCPIEASSPRTEEGFLLPVAGRELSFPRAHGSHPEYLIEWWYLTGQVGDGEDRFGYQATFFRRAYPRDERAAVSAHFGADQIYLAHMAVSDLGREKFYHEERLNRDGWDAGAREDRMKVWNGNWQLEMTDSETETMELQFSVGGTVRVSLDLVPQRPLMRFGEEGISRKGDDPEAVSYYLSFTHLETSGEIRIGEETYQVEGLSWMDHEIASRQLGADLEGWDWTAIHLDSGEAIKAYQLRRPDGSPDPWSAMILIGTDNSVRYFYAEDFTWERKGFWESPITGAVYPNEVEIRGPDPQGGEERILRVVPYFDEQEITGELGGTAYWEGACRVYDGRTGERLGRAYLELVGYAAPVAETLR